MFRFQNRAEKLEFFPKVFFTSLTGCPTEYLARSKFGDGALFHKRPSWFQTLAGWGGNSEFASPTQPAPITDHWVPARWVIDWSLETGGLFGLECTHDSRQEVMLECYRKRSPRRFKCRNVLAETSFSS